MSTPPPELASDAEVDPAALVAGLARELEQLRLDQHRLQTLPGRVDELAKLVQQLADTLAADNPSARPSQVAPSWLDHDPGPVDDGRPPVELLTMLAGWIAGIYLRYSDARLPDCWLWHPDVVEELLWLHAAWLAAYDPDAPITAVGDWHDRQRPGVTARIKAYAGMCSLEAHQPLQDRALPAPSAPTADAIPAIAAWWSTRRDQPGPVPSAQQLAAATERMRSTRR
jgi:hypothetical protein